MIRRLTPVFGLLVLVLVAASVLLLCLQAAGGARELTPEWEFSLPLSLLAAPLAWLLLRRRPEQRLGWVLALLSISALVQTAVTSYGDYSLYVHHLPGVQWIYLSTRVPSDWLVAALALLFLLFPTGSLPSPRWRVVVVGLLAITVLGLPGNLLQGGGDTDLPALANPIQHHVAALVVLDQIQSIGQIVTLLLAVVSVLVRWRRADQTVRQQIKLLLAAAALWPPAIVVLLLVPSDFSNGRWGQLIFTAPIGVMLLAIGLAIFRYRLYDIDRVISRTLSYAVVTGVLVGTYIGVVAFATRLLPFSSSVAVAASTLVVAAAFNPLRRRVQAMVDHRFNRARYDGARLATAYGATLRDEVSVEEVSETLVTAAAGAVQPSFVMLWVAE